MDDQRRCNAACPAIMYGTIFWQLLPICVVISVRYGRSRKVFQRQEKDFENTNFTQRMGGINC